MTREHTFCVARGQCRRIIRECQTFGKIGQGGVDDEWNELSSYVVNESGKGSCDNDSGTGFSVESLEVIR
jgi:hypothetical protein